MFVWLRRGLHSLIESLEQTSDRNRKLGANRGDIRVVERCGEVFGGMRVLVVGGSKPLEADLESV